MSVTRGTVVFFKTFSNFHNRIVDVTRGLHKSARDSYHSVASRLRSFH